MKQRDAGNIRTFRQKPKEVIGQANPHYPSEDTIRGFTIPDDMSIYYLKNVANTIDLALLGVAIPQCRYPERFEAGFRYGLAHNRRTDINTHFRPLFSRGFCWAKVFYRKFCPNHPLAASGSFRAKITAVDED